MLPALNIFIHAARPHDFWQWSCRNVAPDYSTPWSFEGFSSLFRVVLVYSVTGLNHTTLLVLKETKYYTANSVFFLLVYVSLSCRHRTLKQNLYLLTIIKCICITVINFDAFNCKMFVTAQLKVVHNCKAVRKQLKCSFSFLHIKIRTAGCTSIFNYTLLTIFRTTFYKQFCLKLNKLWGVSACFLWLTFLTISLCKNLSFPVRLISGQHF